MTNSLHLLCKDEEKEITELCHNAKPFFDGIFVTCSDKKLSERLKKGLTGVANVDFRAWNDRFDEARQHNWDLGKDYDCSMWLDADDTFDFDKIPSLVKYLDEYDAVFLPYHYDHDDAGNVIVELWRERLINRRKPFYWKGWVHENMVCDEQFKKINVNVPVIHNQDQAHKDGSLARNHAILTKAYQETNDPRYIHYLGISFFTMKEFEKAIETLNEYIKVGGWDEEIYRSVLKISESYFMLGEVDTAILEALKAMAIIPELPMAYHLLCHYENQLDNHKEAIEWGQMALSKKAPKNASIYDPSSSDRTKLTMAIAYFSLSDYESAWSYIKDVKTIDTSEVIDTFKQKAEILVLAKVLPGLFQFYQQPSQLWSELDEDVKYLPELRKIREAVTYPKVWDDNSIVFFCGKGYEEWGPHTLDKGMGGSEEAIVYLAPQLAKLGYEVTVYGEVSEPLLQRLNGTWVKYNERSSMDFKLYNGGKPSSVQWLPWNYIDRRDEFNTLVVWRMPQFAGQFKAKKIFIDMHDELSPDIVRPFENATYLFKSQYHKDHYPKITNYKIIPNGIDVSQFKPAKKKPYSVIYPSAYYRGLEVLLKFWPEIKKQVPEATLDVYYGWQSWVTAEGEDAFYKRMLDKFKEMKKLGVTEHGRVDHKTLAKKYAESKVWAYPTEFPEIFCITAVKANLAGCKPVITDVAALVETGGPNATYIETSKIYSDQYSQQKFIKAVVKALKEDNNNKEQIEWAKQFDWSRVAIQWQEAINET